jgi:hypothetical protein
MKNITRILLIFTMIFSMGFLPVSASALTNTNKAQPDKAAYNQNTIIQSDIYQQFLDLQNKIDSVLTIANGRYNYNAKQIKNIINASGFNFNMLNKELGTNYTEQSFTNAVLTSIQNTVLTKTSNNNMMMAAATSYCNVNKTTSGWNYNRAFANNTKSGQIADKLEQTADNWALFGTASTISSFIPVVGPFIAAGMGLGSGFNAWYSNTLARAIRVNMSGCGTVTDINKFTTVFTVWDQREF